MKTALLRTPLHGCGRTPLVVAFATAFALAAPPAMATPHTWTVNTCNQANTGSGTTGSLRYAVAHAANLDIVDMTGLTCSTITLTTGAIAVPQASLTINGPGMTKLFITGKYQIGIVENDRIFNHTGTGGTLSISSLSVSDGNLQPATGNAYGGCIYSAGSVSLTHVGAYYCEAIAANGFSDSGGAVHTQGSLTITGSALMHNSAICGSVGNSLGGAARTGGAFTANNSTLSFNTVKTTSEDGGIGGAVVASGDVSLFGSTVSANVAGYNIGGIDAGSYGTSASGITTTIVNSTISGNSAGHDAGGLYVNSGTVKLYNSTIAFNTASVGRVGSTAPFNYYAPGVATSDLFGAVTVTMQSTLIANNTYGSPTPNIEYDLSVPHRSRTTVTFSGANNLVRVTHAAVPADTIENSCPLLGPLRNNGGPTQTHALLSHSPGIDQGNDALHLNEDQRGETGDTAPYPYPRVSGSAADIGAYEVQQADIIFNNGFDGCP